MKNLLTRGLLLVLLGSSAIARAAIAVTPSPLAFGGAQLNTPVQKDATLANNGGIKYNILSATISMNPSEFSIINAPQFPIGLNPGVSFPLTIQFKPSMVGQRMGELTVTSDDPQALTTKIPLTGCSGPPAITVDIQTLIFPSTNLNALSSSNPVTITNSGCADLTVSNIVLGGANPAEFQLDKMMAVGNISTGASQKFGLVFAPMMLGQRTASATVTSNDPNAATKVVNLIGTGTTSMLSINPMMFDFGNNKVKVKSPAQNLTVANMGNGNLKVMAVTFSGPNGFAFSQASGPNAPFTVGPNAQVILGIACTPDTVGPLAGTATVVTDVGTAMASLKCVGTAPKIMVDPNMIDFGGVPIMGMATSPDIKISNVGTDDLHINSIGLTGPDAGDFTSKDSPKPPVTIAPGMSITFHEIFTPSAHKTDNAEINIGSDDMMLPLVKIPLTGAGIQSSITVNQMTIDCGSVQVGQPSAAKQLIVTNTGDVTIDIPTVTLGGNGQASFAVDNKGPIMIAKGMKATINITFTPTAVGATTATLTLNPMGLVPVTVNLKGTGVGPMIGVTPLMLDFGPVNVGESSAPQTVTIKNGGTTPLTIDTITSPDPAFVVDSTATMLMLPGGASTAFFVKFSPTAEQSYGTMVGVTLKGSGTPIAKVSVAGMGVTMTARQGGCDIAGGRAWPLALSLFALGGLALLLRRRRAS